MINKESQTIEAIPNIPSYEKIIEDYNLNIKKASESISKTLEEAYNYFLVAKNKYKTSNEELYAWETLQLTVNTNYHLMANQKFNKDINTYIQRNIESCKGFNIIYKKSLEDCESILHGIELWNNNLGLSIYDNFIKEHNESF